MIYLEFQAIVCMRFSQKTPMAHEHCAQQSAAAKQAHPIVPGPHSREADVSIDFLRDTVREELCLHLGRFKDKFATCADWEQLLAQLVQRVVCICVRDFLSVLLEGTLSVSTINQP